MSAIIIDVLEGSSNSSSGGGINGGDGVGHGASLEIEH